MAPIHSVDQQDGLLSVSVITRDIPRGTKEIFLKLIYMH